MFTKGKVLIKAPLTHLLRSPHAAMCIPNIKCKVLMEARVKHLEAVQEDLKVRISWVSCKNKLRQAAETVRTYKLYDELTKGISNLKTMKREELEAKVATLKVVKAIKEVQSEQKVWFHQWYNCIHSHVCLRWLCKYFYRYFHVDTLLTWRNVS